ncbi:hypothetical protein E8E13_004645 [Curvularia kusanoi]|uniref:Sodium/calcium exchanger membrane region domain-containing protein n=1 Tax=Curvularia kusanoi TaxID=90978 RepID=A0A9P4TLK0_CURKU|nr:hypothetical protein E8E13_004645 [Curvularia kusanoi]
MAEETLASEASNDGSHVTEPQEYAHSGRNDSVIGPLPTEGYRIFDARPSVDTIANNDPYTSFPKLVSDESNAPRRLLADAGTFTAKYWSRMMLVFVPIALAAPYLGLDDSAVFVFNCLAIIPLADVLCQATDHVASYMGETTGALVNVTMGNLTELVIFILLVPSTLKLATDDLTTARKMVDLSRATSIVLIVVYFLYLWTQIRSEKYAYKPLIQLDDPEEPEMVDSTMIGLIILPIVGNAAELVSSIIFASRKQTDLAFAVSIGSAIQIALFVTPLIVLIAWGIDRDMTLHFTAFESIALAASSVLFLMLVFDNRIASYFIVDAE